MAVRTKKHNWWCFLIVYSRESMSEVGCFFLVSLNVDGLASVSVVFINKGDRIWTELRLSRLKLINQTWTSLFLISMSIVIILLFLTRVPHVGYCKMFLFWISMYCCSVTTQLLSTSCNSILRVIVEKTVVRFWHKKSKNISLLKHQKATRSFFLFFFVWHHSWGWHQTLKHEDEFTITLSLCLLFTFAWSTYFWVSIVATSHI